MLCNLATNGRPASPPKAAIVGTADLNSKTHVFMSFSFPTRESTSVRVRTRKKEEKKK
jgi:hypothetical protein